MAERLFPRWDYGDDTALLPLQPPKSRPLKELESLKPLIDTESSARFINKLFDKNTTAFWSFITVLESTETWSDALRLIETELGNRLVDFYCQPAIQFTNLIYRRYFPEDEDV